VKISLQRRGDYAVRAMLHLARHHGGARRKSRDIAADMSIPEKYLPQVLATLVRGGLVESVPGPDGGYVLARDPGAITLLQVLELVEGPLRTRECVLRGGPCRWEDACAVHAPFAAAQDHFVAELAATTFAQLALADTELAERDGTPGR
jgi:Rrf2 family transcriptional regulator, iron-sulfur cluster assembly transcription factor